MADPEAVDRSADLDHGIFTDSLRRLQEFAATEEARACLVDVSEDRCEVLSDLVFVTLPQAARAEDVLQPELLNASSLGVGK
eukprot:scaffold1340_cov253-Pinguiococcus_pyrenoidosus.AAC.34